MDYSEEKIYNVSHDNVVEVVPSVKKVSHWHVTRQNINIQKKETNNRIVDGIGDKSIISINIDY